MHLDNAPDPCYARRTYKSAILSYRRTGVRDARQQFASAYCRRAVVLSSLCIVRGRGPLTRVRDLVAIAPGLSRDGSAAPACRAGCRRKCDALVADGDPRRTGAPPD